MKMGVGGNQPLFQLLDLALYKWRNEFIAVS